MTCEFSPNTCSVSCNKYSLCAYYSIQSQFSELQSQFNFIYKTISNILQKEEETEVKLNLIQEAILKYVEKDSEKT
jgi:hypothetical protein